ncbi:MAG: transcription termination/antitermination protein NusG [Elusimicrobiota bacterium]
MTLIEEDRANWYVINTYTGQESQVKERILNKAEYEGFEDKIHEILIPTRDIVALRKGKKKVLKKQFYPGYILAKVEKTSEVYFYIKNVKGVIDFLGGKDSSPLKREEYKKIQDMIKQKKSQDPKPAVSFKKGDQVRIVDGPFDNFMGIVDDVDESKQKVKVMVTIFGRTTPVELDFLQVENV